MNEDSKLYTEECEKITLTLEDGSELICDVIAIFPVDGKKYIALLPEDADEDADIFLYRYEESGSDEFDLINIEDDDEFDAVSDAFDELLDDAEFDEMFEDEEENK